MCLREAMTTYCKVELLVLHTTLLLERLDLVFERLDARVAVRRVVELSSHALELLAVLHTECVLVQRARER